jgi:DNA repair exonuclease SbcCD nuclease subunit
MLFAHIADTHLGYRQFNLEERERDFYKAFREAVDKMIAEGVDVVIHAGDLFDEPRPSIRALVEAKKGIDKLRNKGIKIVMIPGNHDKLMRKGAMPPHAIFDGVEVLSKEHPFIEVEDVFIGGVPYISKSYRDVLLEGIFSLKEEAKDFKKSILVLHQGIDKYLYQEHELLLEELPKTFNYYALGHVHRRIEDKFDGVSMCYSGSTEIWRGNEASDWEANGRGFLLVDSSDMIPRRIDLEGTRPFLTGEISSEKDISFFAEKAKDFEKLVLQLTVLGEDFTPLEEKVRKELSKEALYLSVKRKVFIEEDFQSVRGVLDIDAMVSETLKDFKDGERDFGLEVFRHLSKNEMENAITLTDDFYERWKEGVARR